MDIAFAKQDLAFRHEVHRFIDVSFDSELRAKMAQVPGALMQVSATGSFTRFR